MDYIDVVKTFAKSTGYSTQTVGNKYVWLNVAKTRKVVQNSRDIRIKVSPHVDVRAGAHDFDVRHEITVDAYDDTRRIDTYVFSPEEFSEDVLREIVLVWE